MKKLISLALAVMLIMSIGASAFAVDAEDVTLDSVSDSSQTYDNVITGITIKNNSDNNTVVVGNDVSGGNVGGNISLESSSDNNRITVDGNVGGSVDLTNDSYINVITVGENVGQNVTLTTSDANDVIVEGNVIGVVVLSNSDGNTVEVGGNVKNVSLSGGSDYNVITIGGNVVSSIELGGDLTNPDVNNGNRITVGGDVGGNIDLSTSTTPDTVIVEGIVLGNITDNGNNTIYVGKASENTSLSGVDGFLVGLADKADSIAGYFTFSAGGYTNSTASGATYYIADVPTADSVTNTILLIANNNFKDKIASLSGFNGITDNKDGTYTLTYSVGGMQNLVITLKPDPTPASAWIPGPVNVVVKDYEIETSMEDMSMLVIKGATLAKFIKVQINGETVPSSEYFLMETEDGVVVKFKTPFWATLDGKATFTVYFTDGVGMVQKEV